MISIVKTLTSSFVVATVVNQARWMTGKNQLRPNNCVFYDIRALKPDKILDRIKIGGKLYSSLFTISGSNTYNNNSNNE